MTIRVTCDSCQTRFRFADEDAGLPFECPKCGFDLGILELDQPVPDDPVAETPTVPHDAEPEPLMRPRKAVNYEDLIDMTAMVDIVFFLLIFFLVTSLQAVDSAIDMPQPEVQEGRASKQVDVPDQEAPRTEITVRIDRADRITVDEVEVRGPDELFLKLRELRNGPGHPASLLVIGNGDATHGTLVSVLDSGQELGFEKIRISVIEDEDQRAANR